MELKRVDEVYIEDNLLYFCELNKGINIYELANKCKEWAWKKGYGMNTLRSLLHNRYSMTIFYKNGAFASSSGLADTEQEAIFKACEWILKDKR